MATKRPSLKDRMIEKIHSGTARFRTGSTEDLTTGSESENKKNAHTTTWYTNPQPGLNQGQVHTDNVKATEASSSSTVNNGKKPKKVRPEGTAEYKVSGNDTLASIAAHFDTTPTALQKLNRMYSRNVFAGQTLYVPDGVLKSKSEKSPEKLKSPPSSPKKDVPTMDVPLIKMADKPPSRVPGHVERIPTPISSPTEKTEFQIPHKLSEEEARELDQECYERFIKVNAKHITDGQGVVSGVLLVTPNAVMFDPNVSDPLVLEHGAERYGVIAPMDMVVSAAMYHDIAAMKVKGHREGGKKPEVYHDKSCPLFKSWCEGHPSFEVARAASEAGFDIDQPVFVESPTANSTKDAKSPQSDTASLCSCSASQGEGGVSTASSPVSGDKGQSQPPAAGHMTGAESDNNHNGELHTTSDHEFGDFVSSESDLQEFEKVNTSSPANVSSKKGSDQSNEVSSSSHLKNEFDLMSTEAECNPKPVFFSGNESDRINDPSPVPGSSPKGMRIGNITYLPVSESSQGEVTAKDIESAKVALSKLSVEEFEQDKSRSHSTPMDIPVIQQTDSRPESRSASFGSFNVAPHLNAFVNYATGLFKSGTDIKDIGEVTQENDSSKENKIKSDILDIKGKSDKIKRRLRSLGSSPKEKSDPLGTDLTVAVENAVKLADKPELFQSFDKLIPRPAMGVEDPPLYLCLHLGKPLNKSVSDTAPIQAYHKKKKKPEYWFSIPRDKVDQLYAFFVQWKPELYGDDEEISAERRGFVVLEDEDKEDPNEMDVIEEYFNNGITALQKDWEIISAEEASRRKSVDLEETLILPELHGNSTIIQDIHLHMLNQHMPARTIGYPWTLIYSTEQHGFSLKTLYRDMQGVDSPVMLVVKDTNNHIFGALMSCELKPSDHFYGTGESFLFTFYPEFKVFKWTGDNNFFIKGNQESLSIGAGQGLFGLWFDGDLYHGQTHHCDTYDNDILTSSEDFIVKVLEAWIFTQD